MKHTYQPSRVKRNRKFGFRARMSTKGGRLVLKRRRYKGRAKLSVSDEKSRTNICSRSACYTVLKNKKDIAALFALGETYADSNLRVIFRYVLHENVRILFAVSKKCTNKPVRNTCVRRMRVVVSDIREYVKKEYDIAFVVLNNRAHFYELQKSYTHLMQKINTHIVHKSHTF